VLKGLGSTAADLILGGCVLAGENCKIIRLVLFTKAVRLAKECRKHGENFVVTFQ
jgi:hypothetical protein